MCPFGTPSLLRWWACLVVVFTLFAPRLALACGNDDCDGDGIKNWDDPCPGIHKDIDPGVGPGGFVDPACFTNVDNQFQIIGPFGPTCEAVGARRIADEIPKDALHAGSAPGKETIRGVIFIGVPVTPPATLPQDVRDNADSPATVRNTLKTLGHASRKALLACMASYAMDAQGNLSDRQTVFGYRVVSSYARAIEDAAAWNGGGTFRDGLGLIRTLRDGPLPTGFRRGIVGTNGTIWEDGSWTSSQSDKGETNGMTNPAAGDVPTYIQSMMTEECFDSASKEPYDPFWKWRVWQQSVNPNPGETVQYYTPEKSWGAYTASAGAQRWKDHGSAFGPRPFSIVADGAAPPGPPPPPGPAPPPPGPPTPKFGPLDQFLDLGSFQTIHLPLAPPPNVEGCTGNCMCNVDAFVFSTPTAIVKFGKKEQLNWAFFFKGYTQPHSIPRALDDLAVIAGGDVSLAEAVNGPGAASALGNGPYGALGARFDLRMPIPLTGKRRQIGVEPNGALKSPYSGGFFVQNPGAETKDWLILTGTAYSAIKSLKVMESPINDAWFLAQGSYKGLAISLDPSPSAGSYKYAEVALPTTLWKDDAPFDFSNATSAFVNILLNPNQWNPGGDQWLTNYGNAGAIAAADRVPPPAPAGFAPNPQNDLVIEWLPRAKHAKEIEEYGERLANCGGDTDELLAADPFGYTPFIAKKHWPRVQERTAVAALYGHANNSTPPPPNAHFAGADLLGRPVTNLVPPRLHMGMDINWSYEEDFADPAYRNVFATTPGHVCWASGLLFDKDTVVPLKCDNWHFSLCDDVDPSKASKFTCSPAERAKNLVKKYCPDVSDCSCGKGILKPICSLGNCAWKNLASFVTCGPALVNASAYIVAAYAGDIACQVALGLPCFVHQANLNQRFGETEREMEIELEHLTAFGATDPLGNLDKSLIKGTVEEDDYQRRNAVGLAVDTGIDFEAIGTYNQGESDPVSAFALAPGIMQGRTGVYHRIASKVSAGQQTATLSASDAVRVLDPSIEQGELKAQLASDRAFRVQFLGDAITDCGHEPFRTEIHPPTNIVFHASTGTLSSRRYGIFAAQRANGVGSMEDVVPMDLWPGQRPIGATGPFQSQVFPVSAVQVEGVAINPNLECTAHPPAWPTRIRCTLKKGKGAANSTLCALYSTAPTAPQLGGNDDNWRMLPVCVASVGGGLLNVGWK